MVSYHSYTGSYTGNAYSYDSLFDGGASYHSSDRSYTDSYTGFTYS